MNTTKIAFAAALSLAMASAFAGDWYGVASVGRAKIPDSAKGDIDSSLAASGIGGVSSSMDDHDNAYKLQAGYAFTPNWAVEGGYVDLGKFNYNATFTSPSAGTAGGQAKLKGWNIEGVGTYPINDQFSVFGKLGVIRAKVDENISASGVGGVASAGASSSKWKATFGAGVQYTFDKNWGVRGELERFNKLGDSSTTGESNVDLLSVGLVYKF